MEFKNNSSLFLFKKKYVHSEAATPSPTISPLPRMLLRVFPLALAVWN